MSREFSKCCMRGRKLSRWITKQWDKSKRQLVLKLDSAINELISKRVVTTIELKDSDVHKMPRRKTVINILMVSIACGFCCTLILVFYFGWWFSLWFTCLMLALIRVWWLRSNLLLQPGENQTKLTVFSYRSMHLNQENTKKALNYLPPAWDLQTFFKHPACVILGVNHRKCQWSCRIQTYICVYIYIYIFIYVCVCIYIYI